MSDDNPNNSPTGSTLDSLPEPVEAPPPATADAKESKTPDSLHPETEETSPSSTTTKNHKELRFQPRIRVRWHTDAYINGQSVAHGFIKDISLSGTDIFLEHNLQKVKFVKLHIYVPPLSKSSLPHVMEVSAKVIYTAYDGSESLFHTGVNFTEFNLESDLEYLKSRIAAVNHDA